MTAGYPWITDLPSKVGVMMTTAQAEAEADFSLQVATAVNGNNMHALVACITSAMASGLNTDFAEKMIIELERRLTTDQYGLSSSATEDSPEYVDTHSDSRCRALRAAAAKGHVDEMKTLIEGGAFVDSSDNGGLTPLFFAVDGGHIDAARLLIERGCDVNLNPICGGNSACIAVLSDRADMVTVLADAGVNVNMPDTFGTTPTFMAAEKGSRVNANNINGAPPMRVAAEKGHVNVIIALADVGADVDYYTTYSEEYHEYDTEDQIGDTDSINVAGENGHADAVRLFLILNVTCNLCNM